MKSDFVKQKSFDLIFKTKCDKKNDVFWEMWVIVIGGEPQLLTTDDAMHCNGDTDSSVNGKYELTPLTGVLTIPVTRVSMGGG